MFGSNLNELMLMRCVRCGRFVAVHVDADDYARHVVHGVYVQDCFPYLSAADRELFITSWCGDCWARWCPDPVKHPLAYS